MRGLVKEDAQGGCAESGVTWSCAALESHSEAWAMAWAAIGGERVSGVSSRLATKRAPCS